MDQPSAQRTTVKLAIILVLGVVATVTAPQRFRSGVDAVTVDVLVTRDGQPVAGLTAADFELRDSGVRQQIRSAAFEDVPLNVLLVLDVSASVEGNPLRMLKTAAASALELLTPRDEIALLSFNHGIDGWVPWSADLQSVRQRLDVMEADGGTALHDAVFAALTLRNTRGGSRSLVLLFTDGDDTIGWLPGQHVIDASRRTGTVVYTVNLRPRGQARAGYRVDFRSGLQPPPPHLDPVALRESFVRTVSAETGGRSIDVEESGNVRDAFVEILTEFRTRYLLTYSPEGVPADGWHTIDVRVPKSRGLRVQARRGYLRDSATR